MTRLTTHTLLEGGNMARRDFLALPLRTRAKHSNVRLESDEVRAVPDRLLVNCGLCLPPAEIERLAVSPPTDIDEFAVAALATEGYGFTKGDPFCSQAREVVAQAFIEHQVKNPASVVVRML